MKMDDYTMGPKGLTQRGAMFLKTWFQENGKDESEDYNEEQAIHNF